MIPKETVSESLYELYRKMGLPVGLLNSTATFTIHNLKDLLTDLPILSPRFRPGYFNFVFIKDAYGRYTIDEMAFDLEPGIIYFTNPGNYRTFEWREITEAWLVTFNESYLKENVHHDVYKEFPFLLTETVRPQRLQPDGFAEFEQLYQLINKEYNSNSLYKNRVIGSLFVVLLLKIKEYFWKDYNPIYEGNRSSQIVKAFKRDLENHYRDRVAGTAEKILRPHDYAVLQHLHPGYLTSVIKSKTGKPITTWITERTMAEAKSLLLHSTLSIKEIAYRLGFAEATHFSNYFRKNTDTSPAEFRKQQNSPRT